MTGGQAKSAGMATGDGWDIIWKKKWIRKSAPLNAGNIKKGAIKGMYWLK